MSLLNEYHYNMNVPLTSYLDETSTSKMYH